MKRYGLLLPMIFLAACAVHTSPVPPQQADPREQELRTLAADAEPVAANLLIALNTGDYAAYSRDFDARLRSTMTEAQFDAAREQFAQTIGQYEAGRCQVNKIEKYPDMYRIYYFVKFRNIRPDDPVILILTVVKTQNGIKISEIGYRHKLLGQG